MKTSSIALICAAFVLALPAIAGTLTIPLTFANLWVSPRPVPLAGEPTVILTLADDRGWQIAGIVFNAVSRSDASPRILGRHALTIMNLRAHGYTLRFVVTRRVDGLERERPPA
jgi:hypothetical protein